MGLSLAVKLVLFLSLGSESAYGLWSTMSMIHTYPLGKVPYLMIHKVSGGGRWDSMGAIWH